MAKEANEKDYLIFLSIAVGIIIFSIFLNHIIQPSEKLIELEIIEISANECVDCFDIGIVTEGLQSLDGVKIDKIETHDFNSKKGKELIQKYDIKRFPSVVVISKNIESLGLEKIFDVRAKFAVFRNAVPYIDDSGQIKGKVKMLEIEKDCIECFPLLPIKNQFENFGIFVEDYKKVSLDSSEGRELAKKYNIEFVPSLLISKDILEYNFLKESLLPSLIDVGDFFIFKEKIAPYYDIETNKIKGIVDITYISDELCTDCFNVTDLKDLFQSLGVFIQKEKNVDISSAEGRILINKYSITEVPTIILSKEILDYNHLREMLFTVGKFNENDQSYIFTSLDKLNVAYKKL